MPLYFVVISFVILFSAELFYFKIADHFNIIDKPNHRSSHTAITIRGGGIIFPVALLLYAVFMGVNYPYFLLGLLLISFISFLDDIRELSNKIRILVHLIAVALLFLQVGMLSFAFYWVLLGLVFVIGTINAINFMDGINGITGGYGLITLAALYYINIHVIRFTDINFLLIAILSVLVFNFFNFRTKAKCFAGDVGSVSLAFIIVFFLLQLMIKAGNVTYVLLLLVYGLDTITTIVFRLIRKENIFKAHRSHFYQYLANEKKIPQLLVSAAYVFFQVLFNYIIIFYLTGSVIKTLEFAGVIIIAFLIVRIALEKPKRLFTVT
ncbi:MraY family glycosyltransferase [Mucilaginibacter sp.]|uniref:MraY family glycosyltransferase n=1 Tax=Mucilaginibacter sp. TaxID=1882438 RepID=UPI003AFFC057